PSLGPQAPRSASRLRVFGPRSARRLTVGAARPRVLCCLLVLAAGGAGATEPVAYPDEPAEEVCGVVETSRITGGVLLQFDGAGGFTGYGYGDVRTAEGEQWGFLESVEGDRLNVVTLSGVEGDMVERAHEWTMAAEGIETRRGLYRTLACAPVWKEYLRRADLKRR
ncbi:MAG: hypothetical protein AAF648_14540, partial [Pseudomonadota bacterium]